MNRPFSFPLWARLIAVVTVLSCGSCSTGTRWYAVAVHMEATHERDPMHIVREVILVSKSGVLESYTTRTELPRIQNHIEPELYSLLLRRAQWQEQASAKRSFLNLDDILLLNDMSSMNVFFRSMFAPNHTLYQDSISDDHAEVRLDDIEDADGGLHRKRETTFYFQKATSAWVLYDVRQTVWNRGFGKPIQFDLVDGIPKDISEFMRMSRKHALGSL